MKTTGKHLSSLRRIVVLFTDVSFAIFVITILSGVMDARTNDILLLIFVTSAGTASLGMLTYIFFIPSANREDRAKMIARKDPRAVIVLNGVLGWLAYPYTCLSVGAVVLFTMGILCSRSIVLVSESAWVMLSKALISVLVGFISLSILLISIVIAQKVVMSRVARTAALSDGSQAERLPDERDYHR
jgi:hypothetical protein